MAHWSDRAACRDHPILGPDAWFDMSRGFPQDTGLHAVMVCQRECSVMMECRQHMLDIEARDQVAGGGWFDARGMFRTPRYTGAQSRQVGRKKRGQRKMPEIKVAKCDTSACVEVDDRGDPVVVRSTLNPERTVEFTREEWFTFIEQVHEGRFDEGVGP